MKHEYELKRAKKNKAKEIKKSVYKNPLSISAAIITTIMVLYISLNFQKQRTIKVIKFSVNNTEVLVNNNEILHSI